MINFNTKFDSIINYLEKCNIPKEYAWLTDKDNLMFLNRIGSQAYHLNDKNSDDDFKAIVCQSRKNKMGLNPFISYRYISGDNKMNSAEDIDIDFLSFDEYINLLIKGHFLYLESLFSNDIFYINPLFIPLVENKSLFLNINIVYRYLGFTKQLKHKFHPQNPQKPDIVERINNFGYDSKMAMHLFRVLYFCESLMDNGELNILLSDDKREYLFDIKNGKYEENYLKEVINQRINNINSRIDNKAYVLKEKPEIKKIEELYYSIIEKVYNMTF